MEGLEKSAGEHVADNNLKPILLAQPDVLDELAHAALVRLGETVGLCAGQLLDFVGVIVAHKGAEAALVGGLPALAVSELGAARVLAALVGAIVPVLEDFIRLVLVLHDHEASVEEQLAESVVVVLDIGVDGEGEGVVVRRDAPVVHEPFEREIEMVEEGVGINKDADVVVLEDLGQDRWLLPRITAILVGVDLDVVVLVAVDLGCTRDIRTGAQAMEDKMRKNLQ